jgi:hypothetical protein
VVGGGAFENPTSAGAAVGQRRKTVVFDVGGFEGVLVVGGAAVDAAGRDDLARMEGVAYVRHAGWIPNVACLYAARRGSGGDRRRCRVLDQILRREVGAVPVAAVANRLEMTVSSHG